MSTRATTRPTFRKPGSCKVAFRKLAASATLAAATLLAGAGSLLSATPAQAQGQGQSATEDTLIFRNGNVVTGKIVSETATVIKFKGKISGISFETEYQKADIVEIKRAGAAAKPDSQPETTPEGPKADPKPVGTPIANSIPTLPSTSTPDEPSISADDEGKQRVYWIELKGNLGEQISQTPIRAALKDAHKNQADVVIVELDADFYQVGDDFKFEEMGNYMHQFDEMFRAEEILPAFVTEIQAEWDKQPRIVFWVKQAMAGAALLPMFSKEIYFSSDARMGGIGNLSYMMRGHQRVVEKQISLRLQHMQGWANVGGYPEEVIRAMTRVEYILSVKYVGGKPVFKEGYPEDPSWELLSDDGTDERFDGIAAMARGLGNDVLTLVPDNALRLGISKGTVDSREELLAALGLDRTSIEVPGRSKRIMQDWNRNLENAKTRLAKLLRDYVEVEVEEPNNYDNRTKARNKRIRILEDMKRTLNQWGEGISRYWLAINRVPPIDAINTEIEAIKVEQLRDRK